MAEAGAIRRARRIIRDIDSAILRLGREQARIWRDMRAELVQIAASGGSPFRVQSAIDALYQNTTEELQGVMNRTRPLGTGAANELTTDTLRLQGFQETIPPALLSPQQVAVMQQRQTNLIIGLTEGNQRAVNSVVGRFLDPESGVGFTEARETITSLTGASARQGITQLRTESNTILTLAQNNADAETLEQIGTEGIEFEWVPSGLGGHDGMVGERVKANELFTATRVSGKSSITTDMTGPRDPSAPAAQTINCGCVRVMIIS